MESPHTFKPGLDYHFLTPAYELLVRPLLRRVWEDSAGEVIRRAPAGGRVIDVGCGPGTVLRLVRQRRADLSLWGTDIDPRMIAIAARKSAGMRIQYERAPADALPVADDSMDIVLSTMVFHHLPTPVKRGAMQEAQRVLKKPDGSLLLCDFSGNTSNQSTLQSMITKLSLAVLMTVEPDARPQLEGQLTDLAHQCGGSIETLWFHRRHIGMHMIRFPAA